MSHAKAPLLGAGAASVSKAFGSADDLALAMAQMELPMSVELKPPVSRYFEATNSHRADAVAALFSNDGLVRDEGMDHRGCGAIRDWAESTYRKYDVRVSPIDAREDGNATVVRTRVAGSFVGSPLMLSFRFVTDYDLIDELVVGFRES